ncbi:hypothetical protein TeGR_g9567 [Tetraparma gracilis]|uniref:VWFA domain-containing protein n=1 Tax=Tetraparma gracilis TaxID=2962635 RepID=A0ABQ6MUU8_9STRA|nr:hypothetical protein TeGR_g9567 [Tetraparma gracilis]
MSAFASKRKADPADDRSSFVAGALAPAERAMGENLHPEVTQYGLNNNLLFLFDKAIRGLAFPELQRMVACILADAYQESDKKKARSMVEDLFLLAFQTRWSRGGKGERLIFYQLTNILLLHFPEATLAVLPVIPHYGYWKDLLIILREACHTNKINSDETLATLKSAVYATFADQLRKDKAALDANKEGESPPSLTFCGKFAPTEKKEFDKLLSCVPEIAALLSPPGTPKATAIKSYRQLCTALRSALAVPEVLECANRFSEIDFNRVTSLCLNRKMKAFLNEKKGTKSLPEEFAETGDRHPKSEDRVQARKNLLATLVEKGVKGKDLFPHELVAQVMNKGQLTTGEGAIMNAQWQAVREGVVKMVEERCVAVDEMADAGGVPGGKASVDLSKIVVMSDVSGSMSGTPMEVSIAMGLLISEICHPAFRDLVMMFHETPSWHDLKGVGTFTEKVRSLQQGRWGGSTDFEAAMMLVADVVKKQGLKHDEIPTLMVVSDMQFNQARCGYGGGRGGGWATASESIKKMFHDLGMEMWGKGFEVPLMVFWNVRAGTYGAPADADEEGVVMLSGYSPSLMKFVLSGEFGEVVEDVEVDEETGEVKKVVRKITPAEALRKVLDDDGLGMVRDALAGKDLRVPEALGEKAVAAAAAK